MIKALTIVFLSLLLTQAAFAEVLCDHEVVLDHGKLMPWTSFDNIIHASMNFIENCPTRPTKFGNDPWYLVTSKFNEDATFMANQNNQGSNVYYAVETLTRYYAYTGDKKAFDPVRRLLDRVLYYHTPKDWAWPNVPRTQDNTPDGEYTDTTSEPDKMCMAGTGYAQFYQLTGEKKYLDAAVGIADVIAGNLRKGDADHSPLPFRVELQTGKVLAQYTSNMVAAAALFQKLIELGQDTKHVYQPARDALWQWIVACPMKTNRWSNYYEDVGDKPGNLNQQMPLETARFLLRHPGFEPKYKEYAPALIHWARERFGKTKRFGATSMREQDGCFFEMSSHTSRYASVVAKWFGVTGNPADREEARASFALITYSAINEHSKNDNAINYVGIGYTKPWFSDSYFDYLTHILEGMAELPEMAPDNENHIIGSDSVVTNVTYERDRIEYKTFGKTGNEVVKLTFSPTVSADGKPMDPALWTYGDYRGVPGVLRVKRSGVDHVVIRKK